jgi:predicted nucleic acid-binding Zn ribbon protein
MDAAANQVAPHPLCWSCGAPLGAAARFCSACGAYVAATPGRSRRTTKKYGRTIAAVMFLSGAAIFLFAALHRDPADLILVIAFGLPLCGAGALAWRAP